MPSEELNTICITIMKALAKNMQELNKLEKSEEYIDSELPNAYEKRAIALHKLANTLHEVYFDIVTF